MHAYQVLEIADGSSHWTSGGSFKAGSSLVKERVDSDHNTISSSFPVFEKPEGVAFVVHYKPAVV